ncbi:hypothetical protein AAFF_G00163600 [Aldrovandia affinis]|uniref:Uncharacterized protein n=1 Tax=Aldrovandia affinis TaxID=143900 RepID=A0AAD7WW85_9TELE|nr:hypothetical protein AAFF_G00163600 [Aldrovandia affinis]
MWTPVLECLDPSLEKLFDCGPAGQPLPSSRSAAGVRTARLGGPDRQSGECRRGAVSSEDTDSPGCHHCPAATATKTGAATFGAKKQPATIIV